MSQTVLIRLQPPLETGRASIYYLADGENKIDMGPSSDTVMLKDYVLEKLEEEFNKGNRRYIVDLAFVKWVSSSDIGMMLSWYRFVKRREGELVLVNLSHSVKEVMKITKLDTIVKVFDWPADAQRHFHHEEPEG